MIAILLALLAVVNTTNNSVSYTCNGATATYSVNYPYLSSGDLVVTSTTTGGAVTTLVYTTDYTVNFASTSSTATLTLNNPAVKCPNTNVLKIARKVTYTQPYSFRAQSVYNQALHELAYDRLAMQIQQVNTQAVGGDLTGNMPNPALGPSGVSVGTYGNSTNVPVVSLDSKGRVTSASMAPVFVSGTTTSYTAPFVSAVSRPSADKLSDVVGVKDFGAVGDGVQDDTAAIQLALNTGKGVSCVPGATYLINGGLTSSAVGQLLDFSGCTVALKTAAGSHGMLTLTGAGSRVSGGTWDLNAAGNSLGDPFGHFAVSLAADRTVAEGMYVKNSFGIGIKAIAGVNYVEARFNRTENTPIAGIYFDGSASVDGLGNSIVNNKVDISANTAGASGIYITSASPWTFVQRKWRISDNLIVAPLVSSSSTAITARGEDGIVSNNQVVGGDIGISVDISAADESTAVIGNRIDAVSLGANGFGIEFNGAKGLIQGNIIRGGKVGITGSSTGTPSTSLDYLQIVGNQMVEQTVSGIFITPQSGKTGQHLLIEGNSIISQATAQQGAIRLAFDSRFSSVIGNMIRLNGSAGGGVGVFLDGVNSDVSVIANRFSQVQTAMVAFNAGAVAQTNMAFNYNDVSDGVGVLGANLISVSGSATAGSGLQMIGNYRGGSNVLRDDTLDKAANLQVQVSQNFNSPEGGFTAGPGSLYIGRNSFAPSLWVKESGAGNTGWSGMPVKGRSILVAGTVTVSTAAVTATSRISLTNCVTGGAPGLLSVGTIVAGTSFVINSASGTDTSTICWSYSPP